MEDVEEMSMIDQPSTKRIKYTGKPTAITLFLTPNSADATIQKRSTLHPQRTSSPTRRKLSGRVDEDSGLCIYLSRQSSLSNIAQRIEKALEDGKNSRNGVVVRAMGAAIEKAVCLALELQRRKYVIGILTGTAEVVDDVIPDDNDMELDSQTRRQSTIELRIQKG